MYSGEPLGVWYGALLRSQPIENLDRRTGVAVTRKYGPKLFVHEWHWFVPWFQDEYPTDPEMIP